MTARWPKGKDTPGYGGRFKPAQPKIGTPGSAEPEPTGAVADLLRRNKVCKDSFTTADMGSPGVSPSKLEQVGGKGSQLYEECPECGGKGCSYCDGFGMVPHIHKSVLSAAERKALPPSEFVFPERRAYPIHDRAHGRAALARVKQHGTPDEIATVYAAVRARYPGLGGVAKAHDEPAMPFSTSHTSNWVARHGGLPHYIQNIGHALMREKGYTESHAIATAIAAVKGWAAGRGNVKPDVRAAAVKAVAQWEAMKTASHAD